MNTLLKRLIGSKDVLDYSSVKVVYQTPEGAWRGFVVPFDITFESDSKKEVQEVLTEMTESYVDGLTKYNHPDHLTEVPLSDENDSKKWTKISLDVVNNLRKNISKIDKQDYYVEAQLPA